MSSNPSSILVTDTGIWIDLHNGNILHQFFRLPFRIVTPDLVKDRELYRPGWNTLEAMGLEFFGLNTSMVNELINLSGIQVRLGMMYRCHQWQRESPSELDRSAEPPGFSPGECQKTVHKKKHYYAGDKNPEYTCNDSGKMRVRYDCRSNCDE